MEYVLLLLLIAFSFLVMHALVKHFAFRDLEYSLRFSEDEVMEGDMVTLIETVCSRKAIPVPWLKVEMTTDSALEFAKMQSAISGKTRFISSFFTLRPYRRIERRWQVLCTRRGMFTVSHVILVTADLFGTLEQSRALPDVTATLTVLPKAVPFSAAEGEPMQWLGDRMLRRYMMPDRMAVEGVRPYADGDAVRDLCHSASARSTEPVVYRFCDTIQPTVTILLNLATAKHDRDLVSDSESLEKEIRLCAALLEYVHTMRIPVRLCANTCIHGQILDTPAACGEAHIHHMLRLLAAVPDTIEERFVNLVSRVCHREPAAWIWAVTACVDDDLLRMAAMYPQLQVITVRHYQTDAALPNVYSAADAFAADRKE